MAAHLAPRDDRHRRIGALCVAVGLALLTVGVLGLGSRGPDSVGTSGAGDGTEPTVLGEVVAPPEETVAIGLDARAAVPATFPADATATSDDTSPSASSRSSRGRRPRSTTSTTGPAVIGSPTSITVPTTRGFPSTTVPTTTATTQAPTTTEAPTTTTTTTTSLPEPLPDP